MPLPNFALGAIAQNAASGLNRRTVAICGNPFARTIRFTPSKQ